MSYNVGWSQVSFGQLFLGFLAIEGILGLSLNYVWIHSGGRQANLPAPAYIDYVMTSIQNLVADENVFPTKSSKPDLPPYF